MCFTVQDRISSVQSLSRVRLFATPGTAARQASLSITSSRSLLKVISIESVMPSSHLILCRPLLLQPSVFPSIRVFSNESILLIRWLKYWSFSFSISPSNEHPGLISLRMDWLDLLTVQGTLKSLLQPHSSKASILPCSGFFTVQLSHPYMSTGKTIALIRWIFVGITTIIQYLWFKPRMSGNKSISSSDVAGTTVLFKVQNCKIINVFLFFVFFKNVGLCGRRQGWDVSREQHRNMYII